MNEGLKYGEQGICLVWVYRHGTDADVLVYLRHGEITPPNSQTLLQRLSKIQTN